MRKNSARVTKQLPLTISHSGITTQVRAENKVICGKTWMAKIKPVYGFPASINFGPKTNSVPARVKLITLTNNCPAKSIIQAKPGTCVSKMPNETYKARPINTVRHLMFLRLELSTHPSPQIKVIPRTPRRMGRMLSI